MNRPDWVQVYRNCAHTDNTDNELVTVTRETLRLAYDALLIKMSGEAYHNDHAAAHEILEVLGEKNAKYQSKERGTIEGSGGE